MNNIIYIFSNNENKSYEYDIKENSIIYHFSINSNCSVKLNLVVDGVSCEYHYSNINYDDNKFNLEVNHLASNTISNVFNHGVNVNDKKLNYYIDGIIPRECYNCVCNQENQIINFKNGKSSICPNLLIDNYDVSSSHSAYISKFSDELMFYIMSRGISKNQAYKLLINAFLLGKDVNEKKIASFVEEISKL